MHRRIKENNLKVQYFEAKKGQVFFWHSGLVHGGSPVVDRNLTRKSFVIHFDKLRYHKSKGAVYTGLGDKTEKKYCNKVRAAVDESCAMFFESPLLC